VAQSSVEDVAASHHASWNARGPSAHGRAAPLGAPPTGQRALPEENPVEGVAGHESPLFRHPASRHARRGQVHHVVEPSAGGHQGAETRDELVAPTPGRAGGPLEPPRGANAGVVGHRVVGRIVQEVAPPIGLLRPGLPGEGPTVFLPHAGHAARGEDPHHLGHWHPAEVLGHDEVHQVVGIGKARPAPLPDRDRAAEAEGADVGARLLDVGRVGVEALDDEGRAGAQGCRQPPVSTADVDDDTALDP